MSRSRLQWRKLLLQNPRGSRSSCTIWVWPPEDCQSQSGPFVSGVRPDSLLQSDWEGGDSWLNPKYNAQSRRVSVDCVENQVKSYFERVVDHLHSSRQALPVHEAFDDLVRRAFDDARKSDNFEALPELPLIAHQILEVGETTRHPAKALCV
jgi:hypothetical protein